MKKHILNYERYNADVSSGLSSEQVMLRKKQKLVNKTKDKSSKSYAKIIFENTFTFFNMIWAIIITALIIVKSYSNLIFAVVVVSNTLIAIIQECRAKRTVDKLSLVTGANSIVVRDGLEQEISPKELVLDDVVKLTQGNQIATDMILLSGTIEVNESLLTGESVPIKKSAGDSIFGGSFITSGSAVARVDKIGEQSYIQSLSQKAKQVKASSSDLFKDLGRLIRGIAIILIPVGVLMFVSGYVIKQNSFSDTVISTCASLIGMIPSGMFLLVSIALAVGVIKLSKRKTLVQDLYSLEMLARTNVLCLDKTGTITDGTMIVKDAIKLTKKDVDIKKIIYDICSAQSADNQTSIALKAYAKQQTVAKAVATVEFSSTTKQSLTSFNKIGTYSLGAYEYMNLTLTSSQKLLAEKYSKEGLRVLTLAYNKNQIKDDKVAGKFTAIAFILLEDHIRSDAKDTIKWFTENGVEIKIISGDNPDTVATIASRVGVYNADKCISLAGVELKDLAKYAKDYSVFGRVTPEQKLALVQILKRQGKVVAMTGDGVNDTLALKEADCSIAMADGSEVARGISNLVLLDSKFSSLPKVVEEGRKVINNVTSSSSLFLMKTLFTIALSIICLVSLQMYPFEPKQILMLEMFVIGIPSFFLSLQPNKDLIEGSFLKNTLKRAVPYGIILLVNVLIVMIINYCGIFTHSEFQTTLTLVLTLAGLLNLIKMCYPFNKFRIICLLTSIAALIISISLLSTPNLINQYYILTSYSYNVWLVLGLLMSATAIVLILWTEIEKHKKINKKT